MNYATLFTSALLLLSATSHQLFCLATDQEATRQENAEGDLGRPDAVGDLRGMSGAEGGDLQGIADVAGKGSDADDDVDQEGEQGDKDDVKLQWDPNGYFTFCPCMGRFGNQAEHFLGSLAFGKALNRTIILPPFRTYKNVPFTDWFQYEPLLEYYPRIITMETFMEELAPRYWPDGKRNGYCWLSLNSEHQCEMKNGNPFGPFWDELQVDFAEQFKFEIHSYVDITVPESMARLKSEWDNKFPASEHPVLALKGAPASYPMAPGNRLIQGFFKWNTDLFAEAQHHMDEMFGGEPYVGIHLRTGIDWERVCDLSDGSMRQLMASPQCHVPGVEPVTKEMCYPEKAMVMEEVKAAVEKYQAKHLYIATDKLSYQWDFQKMFDDKVTVHHLDPHLPQLDLIILGQSDFFIGNCISSFTSFVKRERDANGRPSTFWSRGL